MAPADRETTSLTQHFRHEVPILPLMKTETCEKTWMPLAFYFFLPSVLSRQFPFLLPFIFFIFYKHWRMEYLSENKIKYKLAIIRWLFRKKQCPVLQIFIDITPSNPFHVSFNFNPFPFSVSFSYHFLQFSDQDKGWWEEVGFVVVVVGRTENPKKQWYSPDSDSTLLLPSSSSGTTKKAP